MAVVPFASVMDRPPPPVELNHEQAIEWRSIVDRLAPDWFGRENHPLLAQYCRHIYYARRISELLHHVEKVEPFDMAKYDRLLAMHEREGKAASLLATRMRLTQQSQYDKTKKRQTITERPWTEPVARRA